MLSTVDSVDIHIADRKGQAQSIITAQIDQGIKAAFVVSGNFIAFVTETIPEGNKRAGKLAGIRSTNTQMGIAPLSGIQATDIVSTNKTNLAICHQQLPMIQ